MNVEVRKEGAKTIVSLDGRIDTNNSYEFENAVKPLLSVANPDIEVDCEHLEYISSSGLRVFLAMQKAIDARKGNLVLTGLNEWVLDIFKITGFDTIFSIR
jgi:anti-anti-sigma factor